MTEEQAEKIIELLEQISYKLDSIDAQTEDLGSINSSLHAIESAVGVISLEFI